MNAFDVSMQACEVKDWYSAKESLLAWLQDAPTHAVAWNNLGNVHDELGDTRAATAAYEHAIGLDANYASPRKNLSQLLHKLGSQAYAQENFSQALDAFTRASEVAASNPSLAPSTQAAYDHSAMLLLRDGADLQRSKALLALQKLRFAHNESYDLHPFSALASVDEPLWHKELATRFSARHALPIQPSPSLPALHKKNQRIRVAFLSADWHDHPIAQLLAPLLQSLDRKRFEVIGVAIDTAPDSRTLRQRIERSCDAFLTLGDLSDADIACALQEQAIDIAIDLGLHMDGGRASIFSHRAAPVQLQWLGYPGTSGMACYDGVIVGTGMVASQSATELSWYSETVYTLPTPYLPAHTERAFDPLSFTPANRATTRDRYGFGQADVILCGFNNPYKITQEVFEVWCVVMREHSQTKLWLTEHEPLATQNLRAYMSAQGLNPERLVIAKRLPDFSDHLARYTVCDVFLDTFPYGAHSTAADALWAGLPAITLRGQSFASRVCASLLAYADLDDWIAYSFSDYQHKIERAISDAVWRSAAQQALLNTNTRAHLFDSNAFARGFERVLLAAYSA